MALRLIEAAGNATDPMQGTLIEMFARSTPLLGVMPFEPAPAGHRKFKREADIGSANYRAVNEGYSETTGRMEWVTEETANLGGDIDVDVKLQRIGDMDERSAQEMLKVKATAQKFEQSFIKGRATYDADEFPGLQVRLASTAQHITMDSGGEAISLTALDSLIDLVEEPTHLYMLKSVRRRLTTASRVNTIGGDIQFTVDQFGRQVRTYNGLPIIEADYFGMKYAPLDFNEDDGAGNLDTTSVYCLSLRPRMLTGIQVAPPEIRDLGETDSNPVLRSRIEWFCGTALWNPRAAARLSRINDAAATAS